MPDPPRPSTFLDHVERLLLRVILVAVAVLALCIGFAVWHSRHSGVTTPAASPAPANAPISLVIDYGDGVQKRYAGLAFTPGMTVVDAMNEAKAHARPLNFAIGGTGERALLTQIDDLANESGAPGKTRAWQYWINAQYGQVSIGVAKLNPGDRVTWAFRVYESDPKPPP